MTSRPAIARPRAIARPTTPAPMTTQSTFSVIVITAPYYKGETTVVYLSQTVLQTYCLERL